MSGGQELYCSSGLQTLVQSKLPVLTKKLVFELSSYISLFPPPQRPPRVHSREILSGLPCLLPVFCFHVILRTSVKNGEWGYLKDCWWSLPPDGWNKSNHQQFLDWHILLENWYFLYLYLYGLYGNIECQNTKPTARSDLRAHVAFAFINDSTVNMCEIWEQDCVEYFILFKNHKKWSIGKLWILDVVCSKLFSWGALISIHQKKAFSKLYWMLPLSCCTFTACSESYAHLDISHTNFNRMKMRRCYVCTGPIWKLQIFMWSLFNGTNCGMTFQHLL